MVGEGSPRDVVLAAVPVPLGLEPEPLPLFVQERRLEVDALARALPTVAREEGPALGRGALNLFPHRQIREEEGRAR